MGQLRIIAGSLRGRRVDVPPSGDTRPTSDRVREALFSILADRVEGARVLDLYAGSGALGLEALSRGASEVVFVESDRATMAVLRRNAERLQVVDRCSFRLARAERSLASVGQDGAFDVVLADPPYSLGTPAALLRAVAAGLLAPGGMMVVERSRRVAAAECAPAGLRRVRAATYGDTCLDFYRSGPDDSGLPSTPG